MFKILLFLLSATANAAYNPTPVAIINGGTGQASANAAFNALSPNTTSGDISVYNGSANQRLAIGSNTQVLTADNTVSGGIKWGSAAGGTTSYVGMWNHGQDCSWAKSAGAMGDPASDSTCTFTEVLNVGTFGTVTSYLNAGNKMPGILFTTVTSKNYHLCANLSWLPSSSNTNAVRITYNGTSFGEYQVIQTSEALNADAIVCIDFTAAGTSSSASLQLASDGGTITIQAPGGNSSKGSVYWTMEVVN